MHCKKYQWKVNGKITTIHQSSLERKIVYNLKYEMAKNSHKVLKKEQIFVRKKTSILYSELFHSFCFSVKLSWHLGGLFEPFLVRTPHSAQYYFFYFNCIFFWHCDKFIAFVWATMKHIFEFMFIYIFSCWVPDNNWA